MSSGGTFLVFSGDGKRRHDRSGATVEVLDGGDACRAAVTNNGTVNYDITGSATFGGTLTGGGTLVVSGGGRLT